MNAKTKAQISFAVTAKLISAFVFTTRIVQFLFFLNPKFQASSPLLCLYSLVCVKPCRPVSTRRGSSMSHIMRKPAFYIYGKKGTAGVELYGRSEHLCFRFMNSTIPLFLKIPNLKLLLFFLDCTSFFFVRHAWKAQRPFSCVTACTSTC